MEAPQRTEPRHRGPTSAARRLGWSGLGLVLGKALATVALELALRALWGGTATPPAPTVSVLPAPAETSSSTRLSQHDDAGNTGSGNGSEPREASDEARATFRLASGRRQ